MKSPLLTVKDLAEQLQISAYTLRKWCRENKIPHIRLTRTTIRFDPDAIEEWQKNRG